MKNKFLTGFATLGVAVILLSGCGKLPQAEIDLANQAIEETKTAGADMYVHDSFVELQDSMNAVMANIEKENSNFFKNFDESKVQLTNVTELAKQVKQQTETRKEELKQEIQTTIAEVKSLIESSNQLILEAPKGKEGTTALNAIKDELTAIETSVNEANTMLEQGDYIATLDKAKAAKEKATSINTELQDVIAKYKSNVKNRKS